MASAAKRSSSDGSLEEQCAAHTTSGKRWFILRAGFVNSMVLLWQSFVTLFLALIGVLNSLVLAISANWELVAWVAFWTLVVRWPDVREQLRKGAWAAAFLLYFIAALTWGLCSEPYYIYFPSILEKFFIAGLWVALAFFCGWVQDLFLWTPPEVEIVGPPEGPAVAHAHGGHGHDDHGHSGSHGHDSHGAGHGAGHGHH